MVVVKIILIVIGFILASIWLAAIVAAGVKTGLKNYFDKSSKGGR